MVSFLILLHSLFPVCHLIQEKTIAVFGPKANSLAGYVNSLCASMQIPHLQMSGTALEFPTLSPAHALSVNLFPEADQLGTAYRDLISYYGWAKMLVIYSSTDGKGLTRYFTVISTNVGGLFAYTNSRLSLF